MKKFLLLSALVSSVLLAEQKHYEISPMIGYDLTEGNIALKDNSHLLGALEIQFNYPDSKISPEFSILYSPKAKYEAGGDTAITRGAFNGVYTFDPIDSLTPFTKAGVGIENVNDETHANQDGFFLDAGAGVKYSFSENIALKAEAIYLAKLAHQNAGNFDSNLIAMVGLTFAFGDTTQKAPQTQETVQEPKKEVVETKVKEEKKEEVVIAPVEADDDKDGVVNSQDECPNTPIGIKVDSKGCDADSDKDGILNSIDECPNTPAGITVDTKGCDADSDKDGILNSIDECPNTPTGITVDTKGCDIDTDKDGVINTQDICPNTPLGAEVNNDGCPKEVRLNINFETNSAKVKKDSSDLESYAEFLKTYTNYSAKIVGHTDSLGRAAYNKELSTKRAASVVDALVAKGVDPKQLSFEGMGEEQPIADNKSAQGRAQNRRIEAHLTRH